jgi:hypothetical protein
MTHHATALKSVDGFPQAVDVPRAQVDAIHCLIDIIDTPYCGDDLADYHLRRKQVRGGACAASTKDADAQGGRMETLITWDTLPPGEKQARLLDQALDRKREILTMPLPDDGDDSIEATRLRGLILTAADSTINQTIALRSNMLATASDARDAVMEKFIEERRQQALAMIAKMSEPD